MAEAKAAKLSEPNREVFRPADHAAAAAAARRGELRRVYKGVYTSNLTAPLQQVVRRNWIDVAGAIFPGGVLIGRSAVLARPTDDGHVFIDAGQKQANTRNVEIHGLKLHGRPGSGRIAGDMPLMNMFISGQSRAALENCDRSRARNGPSRTLKPDEMESWLAGIADRLGADELNRLRDGAREIAESRGAPWSEWFEVLDGKIGALQGTRDDRLLTPSGIARGRGLPFDTNAVDRCDLLQSALLAQPIPAYAEIDDTNEICAFYEAYFSNFIEGTEFVVDEAERIVFEGLVPQDRPDDAHDILATFQAIVDPTRRARVPESADELLAYAKDLNRSVLSARLDKRPGEFKTVPNRAGNTRFVEPELVEGTLVNAWRFIQAVPPGAARATMTMFVISEVHPFSDGNGRTARLMANAELSAAAQSRFLVPLSYREDYLGALRALSRSDNPDPMVRMVERILRWVPMIDWSDGSAARAQLESARALISPDDYERGSAVLRDPVA